MGIIGEEENFKTAVLIFSFKAINVKSEEGNSR
jgi:hypothetical protein